MAGDAQAARGVARRQLQVGWPPSEAGLEAAQLRLEPEPIAGTAGHAVAAVEIEAANADRHAARVPEPRHLDIPVGGWSGFAVLHSIETSGVLSLPGEYLVLGE